MKQHMVERIYAEPTGSPGTIVRNSLKVLAVVLATVFLSETLASLFPLESESLLMLYLLALVVVSVCTPSYLYGIVTAVLCSFAYDFFITEPRYGFSITLRFPMVLITMLAVTLIISALIIQNKKQATLALKREQRAQLLYELNQELIVARDVDEIVEITQRYIQQQMEQSSVFYLRDPKEGGVPFFRLNREEDIHVFSGADTIHQVHQMFRTGAELPVELLQTHSDVFYQAVVSHDKVLGVIGLDFREQPLTPGCRTFLQIVSAQVALVLALRYMGDAQNNLKISAEKEKMRSNLLRSISHDLRTPLTGILGASTAILEQKNIPEQMRDQLVTDIQQNAQWLIRMVENILTVTRISKETATVHKTLEAAEEVASQAVSIVRGRFPDCLIHVSSPSELLLVPMDATLISQVLINLLENAIKNSSEGALVLLTLKKKGNMARFEVSDHGKGIPEHLLSNLFEIHSQCEDVAADSSKGLGIGLSICQTIIQAHGGEIQGHNREEGGARFVFTLPMPLVKEQEDSHESQ